MPDAHLNALLHALDARPQPLSLFLRDDDAGWDDKALFALLDVTQGAGAPIDLAVIPQATGPRLAAELCQRVDAEPRLLGLHQHGNAHANHEMVGRRCEFGTSRNAVAQRNDLRQGRNRLQALLGHRLDDIFTPPWNRCAPYTPGLLHEVGIKVLSRDRTAPAQHAMPELAVDVDWCKYSRSGELDVQALTQAMEDAVREREGSTEPLGLMLHHARMDAAELSLLRQWLRALGRHPLVRLRLMREVLAERALALH